MRAARDISGFYPSSDGRARGLLDGLVDPQRTRFYEMTEGRTLVKGQPAVAERAPLTGIGYIEHGQIELCRLDHGIDRVHFELRAGDAFGIIELLLGMETALFTALALGDTRLRVMTGDPFAAFEWSGNRAAALRLLENFLRQLAGNLRVPYPRRDGAGNKQESHGQLRSATLFEAQHGDAANRSLMKAIELGLLRHSFRAAGEAILGEGATVKGPILLQQGSVRLHSGHRSSGKKVPLLRAPQILCVEEFLTGVPFGGWIVADEPCSVSVVRLKRYCLVREQRPAAAINAMKLLLRLAIRMLL